MYTIICWSDGGAKPGDLYGSFQIEDAKPRRLHYTHQHLRWNCPPTNNVAEYLTLLNLLEYIAWRDPKGQARFSGVRFILRLDSKLVIFQVTERWNCKKGHLLPLKKKCRAILKKLEEKNNEIEFEWIPRREMKKVLGH